MHSDELYPAYTINRNMPANYVEGELDFCRNEFQYKTWPVKLVALGKCFLNAQGFVYDNLLKVNKLSLFDPNHYSNRFSAKHFIKKVLIKKKRKLPLGKKYLLVFDESSNSHYHWCTEVLPRLFALKNSLNEYCLLLPADAAYINNAGIQLMKLLDFFPNEIMYIESGELVKLNNLHIVTHSSPSGNPNDVLIKGIGERLMAKMNKTKRPAGDRKIYISREKAAYRKIINEQQVVEVVEQFGYKVYHFELMSLEEQLQVAYNAEALVSIHGAGLTNMLFMRPGAKILEFRRNKIYHNQCYWHLADGLGHHYFYLFGKPDNEDLVIEGKGCNLTIDLNKLREVLSEMEKAG